MARETAIMCGLAMATRRGSAVYVLLIDGSYFLSAHCDGLAHRVALIVGPSGLVWVGLVAE